MKLPELASSFRCNKFEDYICKNANLNTKNAEITNEVIMCTFNEQQLQINNQFIKRPPNYICMPNLKKIKTFLLCFYVLPKSLMKLISE